MVMFPLVAASFKNPKLFSISSIHRQTGAAFSAARMARSQATSGAPQPPDMILFISRRISGKPQTEGMVLAASDFPQPLTPIINMPAGALI